METKRTFLSLGAIILMMVASVGIFETVRPIIAEWKRDKLTEYIVSEVNGTLAGAALVNGGFIDKSKSVESMTIDELRKTLVAAVNKSTQCQEKIKAIKREVE